MVEIESHYDLELESPFLRLPRVRTAGVLCDSWLWPHFFALIHLYNTRHYDRYPIHGGEQNTGLVSLC